MENFSESPQVYRPLMAGVMAGIIATVLNIFYDVIFRKATGFKLSPIINVTTIIFGTMLLLTTVGALYALLRKYTRYAQVIYIIVLAALTIYYSLMAMQTHRSPDPVQTHQFRDLLLGIVIISGLASSFLVPYFTKSDII